MNAEELFQMLSRIPEAERKVMMIQVWDSDFKPRNNEQWGDVRETSIIKRLDGKIFFRIYYFT